MLLDITDPDQTRPAPPEAQEAWEAAGAEHSGAAHKHTYFNVWYDCKGDLQSKESPFGYKYFLEAVQCATRGWHIAATDTTCYVLYAVNGR